MLMYKNYCLTVFSLALFLLIFIGIFNYEVDPANLFGIHALYYKRIASLITSGKNLLIKKQNFNERLMQKSIIKTLKSPVNIFILGSSRIRSLGGNNLCQNQRIYNFAVSGAILKDDLAITDLLINHFALRKKMIILGLDPWLLNSSNSEIRWKSLSIEYNKMLNKSGSRTNKSFLDKFYFLTKLTQLISWPYFIASIHEFLNWRKKERTLYEATNLNADTQYSIKYADGSYRPAAYRDNISSSSISRIVAQEIAHYPLYALGGFSHISVQMKQIFIRYIEYLLAQHIKLVFYLPPYEEKEASFIFNDPRYKQVVMTERFFRKFAQAKHITVIGSYSAEDLNLLSTDFMDGKHIKYSAFNKIFTKEIKRKLCKLKT